MTVLIIILVSLHWADLCARDCAKLFRCTVSFNLQNRPTPHFIDEKSKLQKDSSAQDPIANKWQSSGQTRNKVFAAYISTSQLYCSENYKKSDIAKAWSRSKKKKTKQIWLLEYYISINVYIYDYEI